MTFLKTKSGVSLPAPGKPLAPQPGHLPPEASALPGQQDSQLSPPVLGGKVCQEEMIRNSKSVGVVDGKRSRKPKSTPNKGTQKVTTW